MPSARWLWPCPCPPDFKYSKHLHGFCPVKQTVNLWSPLLNHCNTLQKNAPQINRHSPAPHKGQKALDVWNHSGSLLPKRLIT